MVTDFFVTSRKRERERGSFVRWIYRSGRPARAGRFTVAHNDHLPFLQLIKTYGLLVCKISLSPVVVVRGKFIDRRTARADFNYTENLIISLRLSHLVGCQISQHGVDEIPSLDPSLPNSYQPICW